MPQLIEAARSKITEVIQTEFSHKGSQLKIRIVVYCTYKKTTTSNEERTTTFQDKYHEGGTKILFADHYIDD